MTEKAVYRFIVKEFENGQPCIVMEPMGQHLPNLKKGYMGFDLPAGTSMEQAKEIARFMDENLVTVRYWD